MSEEPPYAPAEPAVEPADLAAVSLQDHDGVTIAAITGEVDISNVDAVARTLTKLSNSALGLVIDLCRATYLDSSGISLLHDLATRLTQRSQRLIIVCGAESRPRRVLTLTGLGARTPVVDDIGTAVQLIRDLAKQAPPS